MKKLILGATGIATAMAPTLPALALESATLKVLEQSSMGEFNQDGSINIDVDAILTLIQAAHQDDLGIEVVGPAAEEGYLSVRILTEISEDNQYVFGPLEDLIKAQKEKVSDPETLDQPIADWFNSTLAMTCYIGQ